MARTAKRKMSAKKKFAAVTAGVLAAALLIGGAFAWTDFSQSATNRFRGHVDPDVVLHDDFEAGVNKDVYVENAGDPDTAPDLIVRVKFNEYLQIGENPIVGTDPSDKSTWKTHTFNPDADSCNLDTHDYYTWEMTGEKKTYKPGTGNTGNYTYTVDQTFPDGTVAKETLAKAAPVTMAEYIATKASYTGPARWILDTDGWCYWSELLAPGTATNLLLDDVVRTAKGFDDNHAYFIDVLLEASNATEIQDMIDRDMTDEAKELVRLIEEYNKIWKRIEKVYNVTRPTLPVIDDETTKIAIVDDLYVLVDETTDEILIDAVNFPSAGLRYVLENGNTDSRATMPISDTDGNHRLSPTEIAATHTISMRVSTIAGAPALAKTEEFNSVGLFTNLKWLDLTTQKIKSIDVSKNIILEYLCLNENPLNSIDVSKNVALTRLELNATKITALDVSNNSNLVILQCYKSRLTSLDVSNNPNINTLHCYENNIATLDVSACVALVVSNNLRIHTNGMTSLTVNAAQNAVGMGSVSTYHKANNPDLVVTVAP